MEFIEGFELYGKEISPGKIFISITNYGLTFSKTCVDCLDYPEYVHVWFDKTNARMAVSPCEKDLKSRVFVKKKNSPRAAFIRWNDKTLLNYLLMVGNIDLGPRGVRIPGEFSAEHNALIFNLSEYKQMHERKRKNSELFI